MFPNCTRRHCLLLAWRVLLITTGHVMVACDDTHREVEALDAGRSKALAGSGEDVLRTSSCATGFAHALQDQLPETHFLLDRSEIRSIRRLWNQRSGASCTATVIGPGVALTAAHCTKSADAADLRMSCDDNRANTSIKAVVTGPGMDVAIVRYDDVIDPSSAAITVAQESDGDLRLKKDSVIETIGCGAGRKNEGCARRSFTLKVVNTTESHIVTDVEGRDGPCHGDSGAPVVTRGADGSIQIVGVLSRGSWLCSGQDKIVRLDVPTAREWIAREVLVSEPARVCGGIGESGACFGSLLVRCSATGTTQGAMCERESRCGWSLRKHRFDCVLPNEDACHGIDAVGRCHDGNVETCDNGHRRTMRCTAGQSCAFSARLGKYSCLEPIWKECTPLLRTATPGSVCEGQWHCELDAKGDSLRRHVICDRGRIIVDSGPASLQRR